MSNSSSSHASKPNIKRDKFLPSEDKLIVDLVTIFGCDWDIISQQYGPTRTKRQIRERWQNYLNPNYNSEFSDMDDEILLSLVDEIGQKWAKIASVLGDKSAIQCRNRHRVLLKMQQKQSKVSHLSPTPTRISEPNTPNDDVNSIPNFNSHTINFGPSVSTNQDSIIDNMFQEEDYLF